MHNWGILIFDIRALSTQILSRLFACFYYLLWLLFFSFSGRDGKKMTPYCCGNILKLNERSLNLLEFFRLQQFIWRSDPEDNNFILFFLGVSKQDLEFYNCMKVIYANWRYIHYVNNCVILIKFSFMLIMKSSFFIYLMKSKILVLWSTEWKLC